MGTGRRSISDNHIFLQKHSQKYLGKPLTLAENPLENPRKESHFTFGHPAIATAKQEEIETKAMLIRNIDEMYSVLPCQLR